VVKLEWGLKRTCQNCSSRFYDLQKSPITCPKCGATYEVAATSRRGRKSAAKAAEEEVLDQEVELTDADEDTLLDEEADLETDLDEVEVEKGH
jgi:uncharacterized protein (TIGR02300 family)